MPIRLLKKALWYKSRIAAMSLPEIMHRARETAKRRHDARHSQMFVPVPHDRGQLPYIPGLREGLSGWEVPAALIAEWEDQLEQAETGRFFLLGQRWPECSLQKKWHLDPVTGTAWPQDAYCFAINFRHTDTMGDVKYVWELNRLQYLQPVAALAFLRKDAALAAFCLGEIESWIDHNPPHKGVNWASGIELALRAVSILIVTTLVGEHLTSAQRAKIWGTLEAHALWLERYPSKFSSANNHLTAEGLGLFAIGALCPQLPHAARWKAHGWELLCDTAQLQILPDGVGAEQTPNYTAVVLEMLLLGAHIARALNVPPPVGGRLGGGRNLAQTEQNMPPPPPSPYGGGSLPDYYMQRVTLAGEWLRWLTDEGGNCPRIGDDDNARVIGSYRHDETYIRSVLGCIAATAKRPDLVPPGNRRHLRNALFGFPPPAIDGPSGVRSFDEGGYIVGRFDDGGHRIMLAMDYGYLGYLSIAAHGHADALAIWLHIDSQPVLVDAGTYLYHSGGKWRNYFRGTAAHNTLRIGNTDSSILSGHFNWSHKANARAIARETSGTSWWIEAEHDGYKKKYAAIHRRRLAVHSTGGFSTEDKLVADKPHPVEIGFLIHPTLSASQQGECIEIRKGSETILRLRHEGPLTAQVHAPDSPGGGWYSPTFGEKEATARIVFSGILPPEQKAITHFSYGTAA